MATKVQINNTIYDNLGERWYTAKDDPVALLRAESKLRNPWVLSKLQDTFGLCSLKVLDVGCGAGFLSNFLAQSGHSVTGMDISSESLAIARKYDRTKKVRYTLGNAYEIPFPCQSFEVVCAMDFLEHIDDPQKFINEVKRVLIPGGLFFFHTFNRNWVSGLLVIKAVEWFVKNTPKNLHLYKYFIKPKELSTYCQVAGLEVQQYIGTKPKLFSLAVLKGLLAREVPEEFSFEFTPSLLLGYSGYARYADRNTGMLDCNSELPVSRTRPTNSSIQP